MSKLSALFAGTAVFLAVLAATNWLHMRLFTVDVVFYAVIGDGVVAAALTALLLWRTRVFKPLMGFERMLVVLLWLVGGYAFAISVPTVIDRSLSFYILEKLQQRGGAIALAEMPRVFTDEYLPEHRLVDVRVTEQLESGTVVLQDGCVRLTPRGQRLANFSTYYRRNWLPRQRLLMGQYTDALVDPLKASRVAAASRRANPCGTSQPRGKPDRNQAPQT